MRLRLKNIFFSVILILLVFILFYKLFETKKDSPLNALVTESKIYDFTLNQDTVIQTLKPNDLEEKLKSPLWTFYAGLPKDTEFYEVLSLDENYDGYLIIIYKKNDTVAKKLQLHNFRIR